MPLLPLNLGSWARFRVGKGPRCIVLYLSQQNLAGIAEVTRRLHSRVPEPTHGPGPAELEKEVAHTHRAPGTL